MDHCLRHLAQFLARYQWLLDTYVIEFFTEKHWEKLPLLWRDTLTNTDLREANQLLLNSPHHQGNTQRRWTKVYPLSLLAFVATAHALSLSREQRSTSQESRAPNPSQISGINHLFRRHVKPKKQHEIKLLGEVIFALSQSTKCKNIIDIGSGQGHLARYLAFHYGLNVTTVDAMGCHLSAAAKFDSEVAKDLGRKNMAKGISREKEHHLESVQGTLRHIQTMIRPGITAAEFLAQLQLGGAMSTGLHPSPPLPPSLSSATQPAAEAGGVGPATHEKFILVGLHTCGDLGPTMFRVFSQCDQMVGLASVGCCYMKLTCSSPGLSQDGEGTLLQEAHTQATGLSQDGEGTLLQEAHSQDTGLHHVPERPRMIGLSRNDGDSRSTRSCRRQGADLLHAPERLQVLENRKSSGDGERIDVDLQLLKLETGVFHGCSETASSIDTNCSLSAQTVTEEGLPALQNVGYPLSEFVRSLPTHGLSYEAREMACHAIETYRERLQDGSDHLKIHCHRAAVETILRKHGLRRSQVRITKRHSKLPFEDYARALLHSVGLSTDIDMSVLRPFLVQWEKVAIFFMLRLTVAACVESVLLLDRAMYLQEQGYNTEIVPVFDPRLSPRNLVIIATHT